MVQVGEKMKISQGILALFFLLNGVSFIIEPELMEEIFQLLATIVLIYGMISSGSLK